MFVFIGFLSFNILAQSGQGKLTGKITDGSTNQTLAGVSIQAKGTKYGVATITDGTYILTIPAGTYTISYSYTGYKKKEITGVIIKTGQSTFLDIIMDPSTDELAGVVVTSSVRRETQSSVYSAQRRSSAVSDGISQESIRRTPDNDGAQILKRVTGVNVQDNRFVVVRGLGEQYNQTMINGVPMTSTETNRNAFAFDLIPAAVIDNITINKTATPDMPGNFAGGIVQVNTRDFPASNFFSVSLQVGYSDETRGKDFYGDKRGKYEWLSFGGKIRDLPKDFPGPTERAPFTDINDQEKFRYLRMLKNNLAPINYGPSGLNENIQLGFGKTIKLKDESQFGIVAAINQRKTELIQNEISAKAPNFTRNGPAGSPIISQLDYYSENIRYNYSVDFGGVLNFAYRFGNNKITLKNLYTRIFSNTYIDRPLVLVEDVLLANNEKEIGISHLVEEKRILNSILGGEHRTGKKNETRLDWNINITSNRNLQPDTRNFILRTDTSVGASPSEWIYRNQMNTNFDAALERHSRLWASGDDVIYGGAFNITSPYILFKNKQIFKGGILFQNRVREVTGLVLPFQGLKNTIDSLLSPTNYYPGGAAVEVGSADFVSRSGNYNAGSSLLAAYASMENVFKEKLRVIWGLRVENYQQHVNLYRPVYFDNFQNPDLTSYQFAARNTFNFLPSVNIVYNLFSTVNIRAGYSNTVIRPELKDIAQFSRFDYQTLQSTTGNPELRSTSIKNYDLKLEWFPSAGEILSVAAYYKDMLDPIEYSRPNLLSSIPTRTPLNVGEAYVRGVEAEIRKKIDFIPFASWLSNVTVFGNGSLLQSKVSAKLINSFLYDSIFEHTLTGQAGYILNAGINILAFNKTFEATISYNRTGDHITELGRFNAIVLANSKTGADIPNFRLKARDIVDLVVSQSLFRNKLRLKFNASNLFKTRFIIYQDLDANGRYDGPVVISKTSPQRAYVSGTDATPSTIDPQRTYSFAVSFTF
jgi:outer membrane receptor protein involved in Fe transport